MKLNLSQNQLRLRIDEAELATLLSARTLTQELPLLGRFCLQLEEGLPADLRAIGGGLLVDAEALLALSQRLPCRDGLQADATGFGLSLEVDVRDSVRQRGPRRRKAGQGTEQ